MAPVAQELEVSLAQRLASNDKSIRTKALKTLRKYISLRSQTINGGFTSDDLLKIWKGLFYCLWMQDKPILQEETSRRISGLIHNFHTSDTQLLYFATFLQTVKREWNGIDRLRMDKFFQLVRFMFRESFEVLKRSQWEASVVSQFLQVFTEQLLRNTACVPKGLMLHVLDLYMTELAHVGSAVLTAEQNLTFIDPFCKTMAKTKDRSLLDSISKNIFRTILDHVPFAVDDLMKELQQTGGEDSDSAQDSEEDEEQIKQQEKLKNKGTKKTKVKKINGVCETVETRKEFQDDVDLENDDSDEDDIGPVLQFDYGAVADRLFELGSHLSTQNSNRTKLYSLVKSFRPLCNGILSEKDDDSDNGAVSSASDKTGDKKKKKRRNANLCTEEESVPKKSKVYQVQDVSLNNTMKDLEEETGVSEAHSQHHRPLNGQSEPQNNDSDSQRQVGKIKAMKKRRKNKKQKTNTQEATEDVAHDVVQKANGGPRTNKRKVTMKQKKSDQTGTDVGALDPTSLKCPVEAGRARRDISFPSKKKKNKSISVEEEKADAASDGQIVEQSHGVDPGESSVGTAEKKKRRKNKKLCEEVAVDCLPKEHDAGDEIRTLDYDADATRNQMGTVGKKKAKRKKSSLKNVDEFVHDDEVSARSCPTSEKDGTMRCEPTPTTAKGTKGKNRKLVSKSKSHATADADVTSDETPPSEVLLVRTRKSNKVKETEASTDGADVPAEISQPKSLRKSKRGSLKQASALDAKEQPAVHNATSTRQPAATLRKKKLQKKQSRPTEEPFVKEKTGPEVTSSSVCTPVINVLLTPTRKGKKKRKLQTDEAEISHNDPSATEVPSSQGVEDSTSETRKKPKMGKSSAKSDFVSFQGLIKPPTPLFCKTKPKDCTPRTGLKGKLQTPKSENKKVTFGLKNNKTTEFKKTDRSLLVSPVGTSRVAFDPKKMPVSGVLKSSSLSPVVSVRKRAANKRATAADFF